jgi:RNA polymerase sigma-70 factor (ECF subfamily)
MLAVAQRILGSAREAEDLVHDVFLEAWHHARHYDRSRGSVRTWLMLRVRSRSLDRLRAARRAKVVDLEGAQLEHASDASEDGAADRDSGTVRGVLAALPEDQRAVLELSYFAGYSCSEISTRLEIPIGTVKSRMARGLTELRSRLGAQEGDRQ